MLLLGTSLGSAIAVHFARQHPECVRALVMCGPQVCILHLLSCPYLAVRNCQKCCCARGCWADTKGSPAWIAGVCGRHRNDAKAPNIRGWVGCPGKLLTAPVLWQILQQASDSGACRGSFCTRRLRRSLGMWLCCRSSKVCP